VAYLAERDLSAEVGDWTPDGIRPFNIVGLVTAGWLGDRMPKRYLLSFIYLFRAVAILAFVWFPSTPVTCILFGATAGLTWLSTVPPPNGIIAVIFGAQWLATLAGFAFFSHLVGGFLGVGLGGIVLTTPAPATRCGGRRSSLARRSSTCRWLRSRSRVSPRCRRKKSVC
jgi:MFS family permease